LRIPPFPGARVKHFAVTEGPEVDRDLLAECLLHSRVGGSYWASQPEMGAGYVLVTSKAGVDLARSLFPKRPIVRWDPACEAVSTAEVTSVTGDCDPWHMLSAASALVTSISDEVAFIASLLDVPCYDPETGHRFELDLSHELGELTRSAFNNPFTGEVMSPLEAIELCAFWRNQIDANREIGGGAGFAFWKQGHVAPLLWGGSGDLPFLRSTEGLKATASVAVWRAKTAPALLSQMEREGRPIIEVEDGFLRSRGLGADCVPPLSITVDRKGAHFDPSKPSELERLLQDHIFDPELLARASELRRAIVEAGLGKYERGVAPLSRPAGSRRHVLVPGQVEDDRAVQLGGCGLTSNLGLLSRVRQHAPEAYILYKPHPDVVAGHRRGAIADSECLEFADEIVGNLSIASLIEMVDEVHVNTSQAGFEALLRGKSVTTYGVPFYAGWGLTEDLGRVPSRRSAKRTIDELVAAALLLYPRYIDPVTCLPCPAETVVARLSAGGDPEAGIVVGLRRLQGKLMRSLRRLVQ
jgi:capsular polysaccharide export protein